MCRLSWNLGALTSWNPTGPIDASLYLTCHKAKEGVQRYISTQSQPRHYIYVRGHVTLGPLYPGEEPQCPLKCRLGGPQSRSEISEREWNSGPFGPYRSDYSDCVARYVVVGISFGCHLPWLRFVSVFIRYRGDCRGMPRGLPSRSMPVTQCYLIVLLFFCVSRSFWYLCNYVVLYVFCDLTTYLESLFLSSRIVRYNARESYHIKRNLCWWVRSGPLKVFI